MSIISDTKKKFDIISFGEVMLRLSPPDKEKISQGQVFEKNAGGSELNVASGAAFLGARTAIITKLPDNKIGRFVKYKIRVTIMLFTITAQNRDWVFTTMKVVLILENLLLFMTELIHQCVLFL